MRKKNIDQRVQQELEKTLRNPGLAENLEDLHLDRETRRSAPKTLLNSVHGVNLEGPTTTWPTNRIVHDLLGCKRVALSWELTLRTRHTTTRNWTVNDLLDRLPHILNERHDRWHFSQLFRQLRFAHSSAHGDVIRQNLGHFENLLGIR